MKKVLKLGKFGGASTLAQEQNNAMNWKEHLAQKQFEEMNPSYKPREEK